MQFLQLIEAVASNLNGANIAQFITLTENLISLGESVFAHKNSSSSPYSSTSSQS